MFDTLGSFSVMFFILATILILLVVFEKQCLALEEKYDARRREIKRAKKQRAIKNSTTQARAKKAPVKTQSQSYRRPRNTAA